MYRDPRKRRNSQAVSDHIILDVVSTRRLPIVRILRIATIVCFAGIFAFGIPSGNTVESGGWLHYLLATLAIISILGTLGFSVASKMVKGHKEIGTIKMTKDKVTIVVGKESLEIAVSEITEVSFHYSGYEGENLPGRSLADIHTGLNNFISVQSLTHWIKAEVFIKSNPQANRVAQLLEKYKLTGIPVDSDFGDQTRDIVRVGAMIAGAVFGTQLREN